MFVARDCIFACAVDDWHLCSISVIFPLLNDQEKLETVLQWPKQLKSICRFNEECTFKGRVRRHGHEIYCGWRDYTAKIAVREIYSFTILSKASKISDHGSKKWDLFAISRNSKWDANESWSAMYRASFTGMRWSSVPWNKTILEAPCAMRFQSHGRLKYPEKRSSSSPRSVCAAATRIQPANGFSVVFSNNRIAHAAPLLCPTMIVSSGSSTSFSTYGSHILSRHLYGSGKFCKSHSTFSRWLISFANQAYQLLRVTGAHPIPGIRITFMGGWRRVWRYQF